MCRAPLSDKQPKKIETMGMEVSHQILGETLTRLSQPLVVELYDTLYHDIGIMEEKLSDMGYADIRTRQGNRREDFRRKELSNIC